MDALSRLLLDVMRKAWGKVAIRDGSAGPSSLVEWVAACNDESVNCGSVHHWNEWLQERTSG